MRVILLGAPGAGKGTQAQLIMEKFGIPQISTGDMLRAAIAAGTDIGMKAKAIMDRGDLVSDDVILGIVAERMAKPDVSKGVVFDGFPRTPAQAEALDKMLASSGQKLHAVIEMKADDDELVARISGRFTCKTCGKGYHDSFAPTKIEGTCDSCGGHDFVRRPDDNAKTVRDRLTVYNTQTAPLVDYYRETGKLHVVDGMAEIAAVTRAIGAVLDRLD